MTNDTSKTPPKKFQVATTVVLWMGEFKQHIGAATTHIRRCGKWFQLHATYQNQTRHLINAVSRKEIEELRDHALIFFG